MDSSSSPLPAASPSTLAEAYALLDVAVAWADPQGRLQGANLAFSQLTGYSATGLPAQTLASLLQIEAAAVPPDTVSLLSLSADLTGWQRAVATTKSPCGGSAMAADNEG